MRFPTQVEVGTCVSSQIKVKGFRNVIHWRVTRYDEPKEIELVGRGRPAICIALRLCVKEYAPDPRPMSPPAPSFKSSPS